MQDVIHDIQVIEEDVKDVDQGHAARAFELRLTQRSLYNLHASLARKSDPRARASTGCHQPRSNLF